MARPKRVLRPRQADNVRAAIQTSHLINFLQNVALKGVKSKNTATRIKAAQILLDKSLPSLQATTLSGPEGGPIDISLASAAELREKVRGS